MIKKQYVRAIHAALALLFVTPLVPVTVRAASLTDQLKGRILLQVEQKGEAWYLDTASSKRFFMGRPADAFELMRRLGVGISNTDLQRVKTVPAFAAAHSGKIFLQVEAHGEAWYINPTDKKAYYLGRPADAFALMQKLGLGISNRDLEMIPVHVASAAVPTATTSAPTPSGVSLGVNLDEHADWNGDLMFTNAMMNARFWSADSKSGGAWAKGDVPLTSDGQYPKQVPFTNSAGADRVAVSTLFTDAKNHYPSGIYTLVYKGTGKIALKGSAVQTFDKAGTYGVSLDPSKGGLLLSIIESSASDPVRDIELWLPGFADSATTNPYHPFYPEFVKRLQGFSVIRAMPMMQTNGDDFPCDNGVGMTDITCVVHWSTRTEATDTFQTGVRGVALEHLVKLANLTGADLWVTLKHGVDDEYMTEAAKLIKAQLNPSRKVYAELSNEVWNFSAAYPQSTYFVNKGVAAKLSADKYEAGRMAFVQRQARMWQLFEAQFAGQTEQVVNVLPSQAANTWLGESYLKSLSNATVNPSHVKAEAYAVAPYIGGNLATDLGSSATVATVLQQLQSLLTTDMPVPGNASKVRTSFLKTVQANAALAQKYGVQLIAYEGGQHLTTGGVDSGLNATFMTANRDPKMYAIYTDMLDIWYQNGGSTFAAFSFVGPFSKWGSWSAMEWIDQPLDQAPKFRALRDYLQK